MELAERAVEVREVVEHGVSQDEIKCRIRKRERLGVRPRRSDVEAQSGGVDRQSPDHPRRDIRARGLLDRPGLEQVEAEVAGPGSNLQRALKPAPELGSQHLA